MRIFVTGATGYLGGAVVKALVDGGHQVTGLARSPEAEARLARAGVRAVAGSLEAPATWSAALDGHDAFVHLAVVYGEEQRARDRTALEALLDAARRAPSPTMVVYTSGVWVLGDTGERVANEDWPTDHPAATVAWRPEHEALVLDAATDRIATAVVRPGIVYGGHGGIVGTMFGDAESRGVVSYVGDGGNRWPLVHLVDLAQLYKLVLERRAGGVFHAVDGSAPRVDSIARVASEAAGKHGNIKSVSVVEARALLGKVADALCLDQAVGSRRSHEILGWRPSRPSFLVGARAAFAEWKQGRE